MYRVKADAVYITEPAAADPRCVARMNRMLPNIQSPPVQTVSYEDLNKIVADQRWFAAGRRGQIKDDSLAKIVFNKFIWRSPEESKAVAAKYPNLRACMFLGDGAWTIRDRESCRKMGGVCQSAWEIHAAWGCLHACDYCHVKQFVNIMANLEEYVERLAEFSKTIPWQRLYKYDNMTDTICFEPEYGASEIMVNWFATQPDKYLLLYTKSDNVEHLLKLDHRGHTIINWSLNCETVTRHIEKSAPPMDARIRAIKLCHQAGYTVRVRISPIIPVKDWRHEYRTMLRGLFRSAQPDLVTLDILGWMTPRQVRDGMDLSLWDAEYLRIFEEIEKLGDVRRGKPYNPDGKQLFPHEAREKIYMFFLDEIRRISPETPVAICMETPEMWDVLGPEIGMSPDLYFCCCGPKSGSGGLR
jgi:spore photoproduct lyase